MTNSSKYQQALAQDRFALKVTSRLSDSLEVLPYEISERLRAARMQALAKRKVLAYQAATNSSGIRSGNTLTLGSGESNWWSRLATAAPLFLLVIGLIAINIIQDENHIKEIADIDAALLTDDLPPTAYADPGFVNFLKISSPHYK